VLLRATLGFVLLVAFVAVGSLVARQRHEGRQPWRGLAGSVDRVVGLVALAFVIVLALGALRLAF
jgi:hypothetical protein